MRYILVQCGMQLLLYIHPYYLNVIILKVIVHKCMEYSLPEYC